MASHGLGVRDTAAYQVFRMVVDHTWGPDEEMEDCDFLDVCRTFRSRGGSWEGLMSGDVSHVTILEGAIDELVAYKSAAECRPKRG